ncbi:MAG: ribonuclease D [Bacteroidota bacterium]
MKTTELQQYTIIEDENALVQMVEENRGIEWMGFDTEFIGEKRFFTLLCLIQVATVHGFYLIDTLKVKNIKPFLLLLEDANIIKLTHAGENDYRLMYQLYRIVPSNVFDIQIAAGFIGHRFPISFQKLAEREIGVRVGKGYTVSDWEARPMNKKQIQYALNDVIYLERIWHSILGKLEVMGRSQWAADEMKLLEREEHYQIDPHKEALHNNIITNLHLKEQAFLLRLYAWRRKEAERKNYSKEMILANKYIAPIVRHIGSGKNALKNHRRIPDHIIQSKWHTFRKLYEESVSEEEREILSRIPQTETDGQLDDTILEILYLLIKYKCQQQQLAHDLVLNRTEFKKMKSDLEYMDDRLETTWRKNFLGLSFIEWLKNRDRLEVVFTEDGCTLRLTEPS